MDLSPEIRLLAVVSLLVGCTGREGPVQTGPEAPSLFTEIRPANEADRRAGTLGVDNLVKERYIARAAANADSLIRYVPVLRIPVSEEDTAILMRVGSPIPWGVASIWGPFRWAGTSSLVATDSAWGSVSLFPRGIHGHLSRAESDVLALFDIEPIGDGLHLIVGNDLEHPRVVEFQQLADSIRAAAVDDPLPPAADAPDRNFPVTVQAVPMTAGARGWVGCYDLEFGEWAPPMRRDSLAYVVPPRIRLDSLAAGNERRLAGRWAARPAPGSPPAGARVGSWAVEASGNAVITWHDGYTGMGMRLSRGADGTATGRAETFSHEEGPEMPSATLVAHAVSCDEPMPPQHRTWRTVPRVVHLEGGDSVALGSALTVPPIRWERGDRRIRLLSRPVGIFAGVAEVSVDARVIERIRIEYEANTDADVEALVRRLSEALGPPTSQPNPWSWGGRDRHWISLRVWNDRSGSRRVELDLSEY